MELADFHWHLDRRHKTGKESRAYFEAMYTPMLKRRNALILMALKSGEPIGFLSGGRIAPSPFGRHQRVAAIEAVHVLITGRNI